MQLIMLTNFGSDFQNIQISFMYFFWSIKTGNGELHRIILNLRFMKYINDYEIKKIFLYDCNILNLLFSQYLPENPRGHEHHV